MKGMYFVEMQENRPIASGRVGPQINSDYVFVHYDQPRKYARTVNMAVFTNFALFQNVEDMQAFAAPPVVPTGTPDKKVDSESEAGAK